MVSVGAAGGRLMDVGCIYADGCNTSGNGNNE